jgi:hypothetical protein
MFRRRIDSYRERIASFHGHPPPTADRQSSRRTEPAYPSGNCQLAIFIRVDGRVA